MSSKQQPKESPFQMQSLKRISGFNRHLFHRTSKQFQSKESVLRLIEHHFRNKMDSLVTGTKKNQEC